MPLMPVSEALEKLLGYFQAVEIERIPLRQAAGRVLGEQILARVDLPPFANSSMDGFAVRADDLAGAAPEAPVALEVVEDIPAGRVPTRPVGAGQAARIMTGAPLPEGANAVIPVEETDFNYRNPGSPAPAQVRCFSPVKAGDSVRPAGMDLRAGEAALEAGVRLRPQEVGFLAMLGVSHVPVHRLPRVALLSTGDELLPVDAPLAPGKIYDANGYTLAGLVQKAGGELIELGIVPDHSEAVQRALDEAVAQSADLILSTAGVSVGAFDFVRTVVEQHGELAFWRVNMRPGKPLAFGRYRGIPYFGLPGNPVSAFVGFEVFVRPAMQRLAGQAAAERPAVRAVLAEPLESDGRESYLRAVVSNSGGRWSARLTGHQGSGNLRSFVQANALLIVPSGVKSLAIGAEVAAWLLD